MTEKKLSDKELRKKRFYVKVFPLLAEGKDKENPIPVNDLGDHAHGRAVVYPNKVGVLSQCQINILRDSVERMELAIPEDSGILEEANPIAAAEKQYPGFTARFDKMSGQLKVSKVKPRFAVEILEPVESKADEAKRLQEKADKEKAEADAAAKVAKEATAKAAKEKAEADAAAAALKKKK